MIKRELAVLTLGAMLLLTGCGNRVETVYVENTDTEKAVSQEEATLTSEVTTQTVTEKYRKMGMLICEGNIVRFSERGLDISNYILSDFLLD